MPQAPSKTPESILCHKHEYCSLTPRTYKVKRTEIVTKQVEVTKIVMKTEKRTIKLIEMKPKKRTLYDIENVKKTIKQEQRMVLAEKFAGV